MKRSRFVGIDRTLWLAVGLLLVLFAIFELTPLDLAVQDHFFNFQTGKWLVNAKAPVPRFFFYDGAKVAIIALAVTLLALAAGPAAWRQRVSPLLRRRDLWVVLLTLASAPGLIGLSKATTNVFCPKEIQRYGGKYPYHQVMKPYPPGEKPAKRGRGFPAGHASGGFALLSLAGLAATRRGQAIGILTGLAMGTGMGVYQMLNGNHYLSHTVVTVLVCWILFLTWRRILRATQPRSVSPGSS